MTTALERAKAVLTVWETGRRCFPFTESDTHRYEALRDLIAASEPVLDAEVARMINYYMEMAGSSNGPVEAEICQLTAAMLGRLTTKNARLIAERSAARERIEALDLTAYYQVTIDALVRYRDQVLAILDTPAAPRADDGVEEKGLGDILANILDQHLPPAAPAEGER